MKIVLAPPLMHLKDRLVVKLTSTGRYWIAVEYKHKANGFTLASCKWVGDE